MWGTVFHGCGCRSRSGADRSSGLHLVPGQADAAACGLLHRRFRAESHHRRRGRVRVERRRLRAEKLGPPEIEIAVGVLALLAAALVGSGLAVQLRDLVAVWLAVWTLFLALSLPGENLEHHFRLTWVGFDLILVLAVYLTAHMAFRLDARVQAPATVVATLLVVDAWFDVTTSASARAAAEALILALVVELPAAAFSLYVAHRVGRRVRELAGAEHAAGRHPPVADRARPAPGSEPPSPAGPLPGE